MKKLITLALVVITMFALCIVAHAEGELQLIESTQLNYEGKDNKYTAYIFCIYENTSDHPVQVKTGTLDITDANGNPYNEKATTINTTDFRPEIIQPGERAYFTRPITCKDVTDPSLICSFVMNLETREKPDTHTYVECLPSFEFKPSSDGTYWYAMQYGQITNNTDIERNNPFSIAIIRDQNGKLISISFESEARLTMFPGSVIRYHISNIATDLTKTWVATGSEPTSLETLCYFEDK